MKQRLLPLDRNCPPHTHGEITAFKKEGYKQFHSDLVVDVVKTLNLLSEENLTREVIKYLNDLSLDLSVLHSAWDHFSIHCFSLILHSDRKLTESTVKELWRSFNTSLLHLTGP